MLKPHRIFTIRLYTHVPAHKEILEWFETFRHRQDGRQAAALEQALLAYVRAQRTATSTTAHSATPTTELPPRTPIAVSRAHSPAAATAPVETTPVINAGADERFARLVKGLKF